MQKLAEFIVKENYIQHSPSSFHPSENQGAIQSVLNEDASTFKEAVICVALDNSEIVGSVKVTRWNQGVILPIYNLFGIDPLLFKENGAQSIWHVGRFAISKKGKEGAKLLKKLIAIAVYPICCASNSIMLAECDSKFVKALNLMGIKTDVLAKGITYLGSETLPIRSTQEWLNDYLTHSPYYLDAINFYQSEDQVTHLIQNKIMDQAPSHDLIHTISITGTNNSLSYAI